VERPCDQHSQAGCHRSRCEGRHFYIPEDGNRFPTLRVSRDQAAWVHDVRLRSDNPSLVTTVREGNPNRKEHKDADDIELVSMTIQPGEEIVLGQRLREILSAVQKGKSAA
jgi:hypothetical protein